MFSTLVESIFAFVKEEYGFKAKILEHNRVQYERDDTFIRLTHTGLDEVSLRVGTLSRGLDKSFSAGVLVALRDSNRGFSLRDRIASKPNQIEEALIEQAQILRTHGKRVLKNDLTVFDEMENVVESYWSARNDAQIRQRAEAAFTAKSFEQALKQYRLLGNRRSLLDTKRMEICERALR